ncbi:hypothetical protein [Microvirga yunnanensis]|uniref:hypothetical protein n=1 Tax=Microvirga yunnanensis TaxID=2953740 RepID=UPI0021C8AC7E|nr:MULTISPECIES: hypothetical protein [unclassified Microvirga]
MANGHKPAGPTRKGGRHASPAAASPEVPRLDRFAFTMDAKTGEIIQIEGIDATGTRRVLSKDEAISLAQANGRAKLEELLEQVFEAGIACVLGGEDEPDDGKEAKEDAELRQILLKPLIEESPAARLMRRDVLDRAIVDTLLHHSLKSRSKGPDGGHSKQPDTDRAAPEAT